MWSVWSFFYWSQQRSDAEEDDRQGLSTCGCRVLSRAPLTKRDAMGSPVARGACDAKPPSKPGRPEAFLGGAPRKPCRSEEGADHGLARRERETTIKQAMSPRETTIRKGGAMSLREVTITAQSSIGHGRRTARRCVVTPEVTIRAGPAPPTDPLVEALSPRPGSFDQPDPLTPTRLRCAAKAALKSR